MSDTATAQPTTEIGEETIRAAFSGDSAAFERIVARYQLPVYHLCVRYVGEGADAEDMAQETFIKAFLNRTKFDAGRPLLPWLLTIARRLCIDRLRKVKRANVTSSETDVLMSEEKGAEELVADKESVSIISAALETLSEGQRETVMLYHVDGLQYKDIATVLDVPMGTVMTWLHRGRSKLQKWYLARVGAGARAANGVEA